MGGSVGWASDFDSGHDLTVHELEPHIRLAAVSLSDPLSPSLCPSPACAVSKELKKQKDLLCFVCAVRGTVADKSWHAEYRSRPRNRMWPGYTTLLTTLTSLTEHGSGHWKYLVFKAGYGKTLKVWANSSNYYVLGLYSLESEDSAEKFSWLCRWKGDTKGEWNYATHYNLFNVYCFI